jgi:predicted aldo/keto reductase-like oxidoreductase
MNGRRQFLRVVGATAAAAVAGGRAAGALAQTSGPAPAVKIAPEHYVPFGRTGMRVSPVAAGLSLKAADLVAAAEAGINYFDTAEKYLDGKHTVMVGEALKGRDRSTIFVNAKFQDGLQWGLTATADAIVARVYKALERLGTPYIDSMMIHNVQRREAVTNPEWLRAFARLKADGKVRFLGASTHDPKLHDIVRTIVESGHYDVLLVAFNPTEGGNLYGSPGWPSTPRLLEAAHAKGLGVATMKIMIGAVAANAVTGVGRDGIDPNDILGRGNYLEARIAATRWVLSHPFVDVVQYTMTGSGTIQAAVTAATRPYERADADRARAWHAATTGSACPIPCPAPCLQACPADVAIPDVLHHRMYYEQFDLQKQAMLDYAALPPAKRATACADCSTQACVGACVQGLPLHALLTSSHSVLSLG